MEIGLLLYMNINIKKQVSTLMNMDDLFICKSIDNFKIALALLCSRIQLYYLILWRIWHHRNKRKVREAQKQLMQLSNIRS